MSILGLCFATVAAQCSDEQVRTFLSPFSSFCLYLHELMLVNVNAKIKGYMRIIF